MAQVKRARARSAARWEDRRAEGLCGSCGLEEPEEGKAYCGPCLEVKSVKRARKAKGKNVFHRPLYRGKGAAW